MTRNMDQQRTELNVDGHPAPITLADALATKDQAYKALQQFIPNFFNRAGQESLTCAIVETIHQKQLLACQAGTGVGKTFAYLLGAMPYLQAGEKKLVISTHTIALQTQLIEKDLPLFKAAVMPSLNYVLAKGGERYLCPLRVMRLLASANPDQKSPQQLEIDDEQNNELDSGIETEHLRQLDPLRLSQIDTIWRQFQTAQFDGDLDTLDLDNATHLQSLINRQHHHCPGKNACKEGGRCPFYQQRERLLTADVIVSNHALTSVCISDDIKLFGSLEHVMLVLDEAHQFHDVLRNTMERRFELEEMVSHQKKIDGLIKLVEKLIRANPGDSDVELVNHSRSILVDVSRQAIEFSEQMAELEQFLLLNFGTLRGPAKDDFDNLNQWMLGFSSNPKPFAELLEQVLAATKIYQQRLTLYSTKAGLPLTRLCGQQGSKLASRAQECLIQIKMLESELNTVALALERFIEMEQLHNPDSRVAVGLARWITFLPEKHSFTLSTNTLWIAEAFQRLVVQPTASVIMVSATLEALGNFDFFARRHDIDPQRGQRLMKVESPFDYSKVVCSAPFRTGDPNHPNHINKVANYLAEQCLARHKAILVLFSSYQQLEQVYQALPRKVRDRVLRQQDYSKQALLAYHCQRIERGDSSLLFGVDGLSEGLDLKGAYLTCVIVAKFPFPHLGEPMLKYESMTLTAMGRQPFWELSLPICSRKLIQAVGRLIRSETDYGEVVILDSRLHHKSYAKRLLACLPMGQQNG